MTPKGRVTVYADDSEIELPPFDAGMRAAIRECRFKTVNQLRSVAIIYDADQPRIEATGCQWSRYERAPQSNPGVYDHEARSTDQRVIEYVTSLPAHGSEALPIS